MLPSRGTFGLIRPPTLPKLEPLPIPTFLAMVGNISPLYRYITLNTMPMSKAPHRAVTVVNAVIFVGRRPIIASDKIPLTMKNDIMIDFLPILNNTTNRSTGEIRSVSPLTMKLFK
ncbi:unnamed protein product [Owenia fusiformis]|uniref:Uncharacterized protein n=1 Tax=Owenia fusiformis TaxID=6347 RepID=A0A8J1UR78_OWEFU|nr:unnamed protein product [Owenia fusiformis]